MDMHKAGSLFSRYAWDGVVKVLGDGLGCI